MSEEEDHIRRYVPMFRRMIVVVALLTAIPVAMWTITTFVRGYVGPPKLPTFRPIAANVAAGDATASAGTTVEANAATADSAAPSNPGPASAAAAAPPKAAAKPGFVMVPTSTIPSAVTAAAPSGSNPPGSALPFAAQQPAPQGWPTTAATSDSADTLQAEQPIAGPVPLPRKRPRVFRVAQGPIPLPRPRPEMDSPAAAPSASPTPLNWFQHIFRQNGTSSTGGTSVTAADDSGNTEDLNH